MLEQQLLIIFYKEEVKKEASLANVALLARAREKLMKMKSNVS